MGTILVTGYEAYGNTPVDPAEAVATRLDGRRIGDAVVASRIVPNSFFVSIERALAAIGELGPEVVVMLGEFTGRAMVTVERIAQNLNDGTRYGLLDNAGVAMQDELTAPDGPAAYYATLPIRAMVRAMRRAGIPADISDAPGTFCCNHLMYGVLHHIETRGLPVRAGWIHLPALPEVAALEGNLGMASMSAETATKGMTVAIEAVLANPVDIDEPIRSRLQV